MQASVVNQFLNPDQLNSGEFPSVIEVSCELQEVRLKLEVNDSLIGFRGHFPGNPVLAGIVQVHWAATFASNFFDYQRVPTEIKRLKFKNVVQPPATLELSLRQVDSNSIQFEFTSSEFSHSMGLLVFEPVVA